MIVEWFTPSPPRSYEWIGQAGETLALIEQGGTSAVSSVVGPAGPAGPSGAASSISTDANQAITLGTDGGIYAPATHETTPDILDAIAAIDSAIQ